MSDNRLIGRIVRKDVGAARPKGILLEDALDALLERWPLDVVESRPVAHLGNYSRRYGRMPEEDGGWPIQIEWVDYPGAVPGLVVECMGEAWILIRSFLQERGFFREYPKGQPRRPRRMKIRQRRLL